MTEAVSYTHLDVYKRQDMDTLVRPQDDFYHYVNGGWIKANPLKPAYSRFGTFDVLGDRSLEPVSYTHLDVYKRQSFTRCEPFAKQPFGDLRGQASRDAYDGKPSA